MIKGDSVQVTSIDNHGKGLSDARDYYNGMIGIVKEVDVDRDIVKLDFDDGCSIWFTSSEVSNV